MKLSIIIPVFNEGNTIETQIKRVDALNLDKEIIVVDDGSQDKTDQILNSLLKSGNINFRLIALDKNQGKGYAIRKGLETATGEIVAILDADIEQDPKDLLFLIKPILENKADGVIGSRNLKKQEQNFKYKLFFWGGKFLSAVVNVLFNTKFTDVVSGYKVIRTDAIKNLNLKSSKFEIDAEILVKLLKNKYKVIELPVSYRARSFAQGKKIRMIDGLKFFWAIIKYFL